MYSSPLLVRSRIPVEPDMCSFIQKLRDDNGYPHEKFILSLAGLKPYEFLDLRWNLFDLPKFAKLLYISIPDLYKLTLHRFSPLFFPKRFLDRYQGLPCFRSESDEQRIFCQSVFHSSNSRFICPSCLEENGYDYIFWRLTMIPACPIHHCFLVDKNPYKSIKSMSIETPIDDDDANALKLFLYFLGAKYVGPFDFETLPLTPWLGKLPPDQFMVLVKWIIHFSFNDSPEKWSIGSSDQIETMKYLRHIYETLKLWPISMDEIFIKFFEKYTKDTSNQNNSILATFGEDYRAILRLSQDYPFTATILVDTIRRFIENQYLFFLSQPDPNQDRVTQNDLMGTSIFLGIPQNKLAPLAVKMKMDGFKTIGNCTNDKFVNWNLVDYIFQFWPKNALRVKEYSSRYGIKTEWVQQLINDDALTIDKGLINLGIPEPLILYHQLNFLGACWNTFYFCTPNQLITLPHYSKFISLPMAIRLLNNDISILLKSMITGNMRYAQMGQSGRVENYLLCLSDVLNLSKKIKSTPETEQVVELCMRNDLLKWDQAYPLIIDKWIKEGGLKVLHVSTQPNTSNSFVLYYLVQDLQNLVKKGRILVIKKGTELHNRIKRNHNFHYDGVFRNKEIRWEDELFVDPRDIGLLYEPRSDLSFSEFVLLIYRWGKPFSQINKNIEHINYFKSALIRTNYRRIKTPHPKKWRTINKLISLDKIRRDS